ncbi:MAG TPA: hypothetical protein VN833_13935, partial [Candidatus Acidoferrales bacterium]|nr:hypothetical protein [Candidatus Acidoferrales bacterium]
MADLNNEDGGRSCDRALGMHRRITRRDFLNGMAVGAGSVLANSWIGGLLSAQTLTASAQDRRGYYPPILNGMRGSHPG